MIHRFRVPALCVLAILVVSPAVRADRIELVAGGGDSGDNVPAAKAKLVGPFGVDFDKAGNLYVVEMPGQRVLRIDSAGQLHVLAGTGRKGNTGDGGPAARATFNGPHSLIVVPDGAVWVADTWNNRLRRIDPRTSVITPAAGTGKKGFGGDGGPAAGAVFGGLYCAALDPQGKNLYLADLDNHRIRAIDLGTGVVRTVAGNGKKGVPADGADARTAPLLDPRAVAADADGNVYILERAGHALRVVDRAGKIRTVAGTGKKGFSGDDGPARQATLNGPKHLCTDRDGNVLIADTENHAIRKYLPREGKIVRVAGTGKRGIGGLGGSPLQAELAQPHGVHVRPDGTIYIADSSNNRVLRIVP